MIYKKINCYLLLIFSIFTITNLCANYVAITDVGNQIASVKGAFANVIKDYPSFIDNNKTTNASTYNYHDDVSPLTSGVDLSKERLNSLSHSFYILNRHLALLKRAFNPIKNKESQVKSICEVIDYLSNDNPLEETALGKLYRDINRVLYKNKNSLNNECIKSKNFVKELNNTIFFIHCIYTSLDYDNSKLNALFNYITAYIDMQELDIRNNDYASAIVYRYLSTGIYDFSFAIELYQALQQKAPEIKKYHSKIRKIIKPICSDECLNKIYNPTIKKELQEVSSYHQQLIDFVKKLCSRP